MSFASEMKDVANELLTEFGQSITITSNTFGEYSTDTLTNISSITTYDCYGHPSPYTSQEIDGTNILASDVKCLVYTTNTPKVGDIVEIDGVAHQVESVERVKAQGSTIVYRLQLRI